MEVHVETWEKALVFISVCTSSDYHAKEQINSIWKMKNIKKLVLCDVEIGEIEQFTLGVELGFLGPGD